MDEQFKKDVDQGLSGSPKTLPSKYFYDSVGDALFVKIMHMPEYYLTRAELEIFKTKSKEIIDAIQVDKSMYFELIELGAGDGLKTKELLSSLIERGFNFDYFPVDISQNALNKLKASLTNDLPTLGINTRQGDYFEILASLKKSNHPKVILFLGSNMGNMTDETAAEFVYDLGSNLYTHDKLLMGVDLQKDASIVLPAYNDDQGITEAFNLNLLSRINNELGGNFDIGHFAHRPLYSEDEGIARSYLVSLRKQEVYINALRKSYTFQEGEKIATEISRKYNDEIIERIIENTDFTLVKKLTDEKNYFANYILAKI